MVISLEVPEDRVAQESDRDGFALQLETPKQTRNNQTGRLYNQGSNIVHP